MRTFNQASINKPLVIALFAVLAINTSINRYVAVEATTSASEKVRETEEGTIYGEVKVDGVKKEIKMQIIRTAKSDDAGNVRIRYRIKPVAKDLAKAYALSDDAYTSSEERKRIENCDDCTFNSGFETNSVVMAAKDIKDKSVWLQAAFNEAVEKGLLSDYVEEVRVRGKAKDTKGKSTDDSKVAKEKSAAQKKLDERIYNCEIDADSKIDDGKEVYEKLSAEEKVTCYSKRIDELASKHGEKDANGKKITDETIRKFYKKLETHLSKCLADKNKREDSGCLEVAEDVKDKLIDHDSNGVHNMGHQVEGLMARGQVKIESAEVLAQLSTLNSSLRSAEAVAQRTGNFAPVTMLQTRLQQLHQYHLQRQLPVPGNAAFYLSQLELDPEIGLGSMTSTNEMQMLNSRIEEQFMTAANPRANQSRYGMNGMMGMNGMNGMMNRPMMPMNGMMPGMQPGMMMNRPMMPMNGMMPGMMNRPMMPMGPYQNGYAGGAFAGGINGGYMQPYSPYNPMGAAGSMYVAPGGGMFGNGGGAFGARAGYPSAFGGFGGGFGGGAYIGANVGGGGFRPLY